MDSVTIPKSVFESKEYRRLPLPQRVLLMAIYSENHDCESFTIDVDDPHSYGFAICKTVFFRYLKGLVDVGLLEVVNKRRMPSGSDQRVFSFKYRS